MKIDRDKKGIGSYISPGKSQIPEVKRVNPGSFEQELMHKRESELQLRMKEILKELDRIGGRLSRNLNINDLMLYKRMVKLPAGSHPAGLCLEQGTGPQPEGEDIAIYHKCD